MGSFEARRLAGIVQSEIRLMTAECVRVGGINLAQGICDLAVPAAVLEGAERALRGPTNTYSKAAGIAELRHAIAAKLLRDNGIKADPESEIVVTDGVTGAYSCTLHGLLNPGDGLLLFEPYYAYHRNIAASLEL
ncbi:MAG: aminotransferase class I/II-fold pyridoxal phosphate-dependent enzyme, partial [Deltaproteobacteria bacterium]|nr:aminotransferase class I/II-fold pyridoxal phosphate-dependent enzyme [Deltaproteobacteria bacterium]